MARSRKLDEQTIEKAIPWRFCRAPAATAPMGAVLRCPGELTGWKRMGTCVSEHAGVSCTFQKQMRGKEGQGLPRSLMRCGGGDPRRGHLLLIVILAVELLVPVEAVNADKDGDFVYVVENNVVVRKDVVTGVSSDSYIEVVSGLEVDDQVMTEISLDIKEGMEVMAIPETDMMEMSESSDNSATETDASVDMESSVESE